MDTARDEALLRDMLDAARQIVQYAHGRQRDALDDEPMFRDALIRQLEILGEAASRVSDDSRNREPAIPWPQIVGMRNQLIHAYRRVDPDILWRTVDRDIPDLVGRLESLLRT